MTTTTDRSTTTSVVSFENVNKSYGAVHAVAGLTLTLRPGETVALLGPNGAGKSSALDLLLGLRKADSGTVTLFGTSPRQAIAAGRVGAMLQSGGLMEGVTVRELVKLACDLHPDPYPVSEVLARAGITSFADRRIDKLSGGQEQRVRFALATAGANDLIVLDEPTTGMDVTARLAFLGAPLSDLLGAAHQVRADVLGGIGLIAFVAAYLGLVFRHTGRALQQRTVYASLAFMFALALLLSGPLGSPWLVLFVYVSVASGATLPLSHSRFAILVVVGVMVPAALRTGDGRDFVGALVIPALLGGFAMTGVRQMVRTTVELREARATVAALAANEERLRLARDLHDLLGHSLSLITLKSELAGRMLPERPDRAAEQVADIERVSRQALDDVREAVTGYRRPTLPGELAGARTALAVAGISAEVPVPETLPDGLCEDSEAVLAWSLREAVTNVVRHSAARRCVIGLTSRQTLEGPVLELTVEDDGRLASRGAGAPAYGNGLTGLTERLAKAGGTLETGVSRAGFVLTARAPLTAPADRMTLSCD